jgi:seryl-tRNA synthetase
MIVAILENHQNQDGSINVPKALRPFLGVDTLVPTL